MKHYLAIDLGASSGRVMEAAFDGKAVALREIHRFENHVVRVHDGSEHGRLHWDYLRLFEAIKVGLRKAADEGIEAASIGIDTWGVDYALVGKSGRLIHLPTAYRDERNQAVFQPTRDHLGDERIYRETGIQFMPINTLYQLAAEAQDPDRPLERAACLLMVPDLLGYWLTGRMANEHTFASTSQCYDSESRSWCTDMLAEIGVPASIFPPIRMPGDTEPLGTLTPQVARETRLPETTRVSVVGSHDTASAVVAVPMTDRATAAYISSGTWSLVGLELDAPVRTPQALSANFTNEAGIDGTTRFLKNCAGLWLIQECRRVWSEQGQPYSYAELATMAAGAEPLISLFDPDNPEFASPGDMPSRIRRACEQAGEPVPAGEAALIRAILDSLAMRYDQLLKDAAALTGRVLKTLHIVGGGVANAVLNRITADATGLEVIAGPSEATALGNALVQAMACGDLEDLAAIRRVVANSTQTQSYSPSAETRKQEQYAAARARFASRITL
ncbi:MAG: rhamnulokinase family protein [Planctomycetota bacterium]